ncbi:hypothetical protein FQN54_004030 [Arachnomyces sp. PD_36]|nr:hypothetical protein FQN54_004030 [Arachnomyces sp. PD_36]
MEITNFVVSHREEALLIGDYDAYRAQLSRRLHTVRKRLGQTTPKGRKYTPKAPVTAENVAANTEYIHLLLLCSERAWADAMHMRTVHSADPSSKGIVGAARRHIITRLNKAAVYAKSLVTVLEESASGASKTDLLEARAYQASLSGAMWMEKQRWEECVRQYSLARVIYSALSVDAKKETIRDLLSGTIDPSIRYSAYQLKIPRTVAIKTVAVKYFPSDSALRAEVESLDPGCLAEDGSKGKTDADGGVQDIPRSITWRSRTVKIEDASISQALADTSAAESRLSTWLAEPSGQSSSAKEKAAAYDNVILASQEAVDATKTAIDELVSEGVEQGDSRIQSLQITRTAVNYALIGWRVGRNRVLCGEQDGLSLEPAQAKHWKKTKEGAEAPVMEEESNGKRLARLREQVVLYDATLQSLDFIEELPGVAADSGLVEELKAQRNYFQALKCLAVGRSHGILSNGKNALALFARALDLASQSNSSNTLADTPQTPPKLGVSTGQAKTLCISLQGLVWRYQGLVEMQELSKDEKSGKASYLPPVIERMDEYPNGEVDLTKLVTYPSRIEPVPVKPLFLDVAWNYIDYPRPGTKAAAAPVAQEGSGSTTTEKKEGKKGWFGFGR